MLISCLYQEEPEHWLIVGLWTEDTILLQCLSDDRHSCTLDCSDVGQPRSIMAAEMHGTWFLFVGTSQGWVVYHAITWQAGTVHAHLQERMAGWQAGLLMLVQNVLGCSWLATLLHADSANKPVMHHACIMPSVCPVCAVSWLKAYQLTEETP